VHGGVKIYRGNPAAARSYGEADHARVDDYYLAEGTCLAERFVATPDGVEAVGALDGDMYESWVAGLDPMSREPRGRLRRDPSAVRFVEVVVNGPKTWSLAASLHPEIADAYDAAQNRAAQQVIGWLAQHATTRVGPRGRQVQVPVERIEAVTVRHYTSRAGDPHRHLHLQVNARVWVAGKWRGLHTVGVRDMIDAVNGIGHAAVMCDPQFRQALADRGFTLDSESGEVNELASFVGTFSARAHQIGKHIERYEAAWRDSHPGQEPGPDLLRTWDRRAWSEARPDKVVPTDGTVLTDRWVGELHQLGFRSPAHRLKLHATRTGEIDREAAVDTVLSRLGAKRSAWNAADIRGQVELLIARGGVITDLGVRAELAEDLTARAVTASVPLLDQHGTPEHIRARWAQVRLAKVSHADVQRWVTELSTKRSPATVRKVHRVLSLILDMAVKDGRLARNVASGVNLPRPAKREQRFLTHGQVEALAAACARPSGVSKHRRLDERENETYRLVVLFLAYTGVRFGEMAALQVSRLDLDRRRATIAESVTVVGGKDQAWGTPKSHERRQVPIPKFLVAELRAHIADKEPNDLVFAGVRGGGPLRAAIFRAGFDAAAKTIGIPELHPHELRHTAASLAIASGADVKVIQQMLGHSSAAMTMDVYGHLLGDRLDEVAEALDDARTEAARATQAARDTAGAVAKTQNAVAKVLPNADVVDLAAYRAKDKTAGQPAVSDGAPGRIRTCAPASGGRCSIP